MHIDSRNQLAFDLEIPLNDKVSSAVQELAENGGVEALGAVFTKEEVVDFILDLVGYTSDQKLSEVQLLEPSFGAGDFLFPTVRRLLESYESNGMDSPFEDLQNSIRAVELHKATFAATKASLESLLARHGLKLRDAQRLCDKWLVNGDFLLSTMPLTFDFVVGNPPYVRQEAIPRSLVTEYRARYKTMYDRADLYIPFIERSLTLLNEGGALGFICSDRWMKNRYGGPLRKFVSEGYHLLSYVDMSNTPAFHSEVVAYPAITTISRQAPGPTRVASQPQINQESLSKLSKLLRQKRVPKGQSIIREIEGVVNGSEPWLLNSTTQTSLIRRLEEHYPTLEQVGCKVGIGVATGADKAFIGDFEVMDVEEDRKIPLATTQDLKSGEVQWRGRGVINPFTDSGDLVELSDYPRLASFIEARKEIIGNRHCAKKNPAKWFRTIDRITPALMTTPKLLIPDIKGEAHVVYEPGKLYPHHNLYYVTSKEWDLRALQAVLLSRVARFFISTYSTKMRGGFLRFQAQYLRRIRVPRWEDVPEGLRSSLNTAAVELDLTACNNAVYKLYKLTKEEQKTLEGDQ